MNAILLIFLTRQKFMMEVNDEEITEFHHL